MQTLLKLRRKMKVTPTNATRYKISTAPIKYTLSIEYATPQYPKIVIPMELVKKSIVDTSIIKKMHKK